MCGYDLPSFPGVTVESICAKLGFPPFVILFKRARAFLNLQPLPGLLDGSSGQVFCNSSNTSVMVSRYSSRPRMTPLCRLSYRVLNLFASAFTIIIIALNFCSSIVISASVGLWSSSAASMRVSLQKMCPPPVSSRVSTAASNLVLNESLDSIGCCFIVANWMRAFT